MKHDSPCLLRINAWGMTMTIQSLDQALRHIDANDPLRPDAYEVLLGFMTGPEARARFASWSGLEHDEVVSRLLESWLRRGKAIIVNHSARGVVLRSLRNEFIALDRERRGRSKREVPIDDDAFGELQLSSPHTLEHPGAVELMESMPTLGEDLLSEQVDDLLEDYVIEHLIPLCSRRTRASMTRFIRDRVAIERGSLTLAEAAARDLEPCQKNTRALAIAKNTYHQNTVRSRARLQKLLDSVSARQSLGLTDEEVEALRRWMQKMGML